MPDGTEHPGAGWFSKHRFLTLLLGLVLLFVGYPLVREIEAGQLLYDVMLAAVYLIALLGVFTERRFRLLAVLLGAPAILGGLTHYVLRGAPRGPMGVAFHVAAAVFLVLVIGSSLRGIYRREVSRDSFFGAFCAYSTRDDYPPFPIRNYRPCSRTAIASL